MSGVQKSGGHKKPLELETYHKKIKTTKKTPACYIYMEERIIRTKENKDSLTGARQDVYGKNKTHKAKKIKKLNKK